MKQPLLALFVICLLLVVAVKFVPPVNDLARETLPAPLLKALGEKPKGLLEQGLDDLKKLIKP